MRVLLINASEPEETRAAVVHDGVLEEFRCERAAAAQLVGNIYHGRVVNVEKGIEAAFVDIGLGRNAFLHVSDCVGVAPGEAARIHDHARVGQAILVQVTRESIGSKGPVLTANLSLPGRFLVFLPFAEAGGVSRRIPEGDDRKQLKALARELEGQSGGGLIVRTAGAQRTQRELSRDLRVLVRLWNAIRARAEAMPVPSRVHEESDLVWRALRDLADADVAEIHVDTPEALARALETVRVIQPELAESLRLHAGTRPLFHAHGVEEQVDHLYARRVPLPGGGSVVFDRTEAMVAVDVNSGRGRHESGLEETALRTNLEAAAEIARQVRLRDLGGVIAVDFIDMREPAHVREVERLFREHLRRDRARVRAGRMGPFGVWVLTRRRAGGGAGAAQRPCPRCGGTGELVQPQQVALRVFRELQARAAEAPKSLRARVSPEVAELLRATRSGALDALRGETGCPVRLEPDPTLPAEAWEVAAP